MKIAYSWFLLSAILSIAIILLAPRALPVGDRVAEGMQLNSELQLLKDLLRQETIDRELLQNRYRELHRDLKPSVIRAQIEGVPKLIILLSLLGLNIINMLLAIGLLIGPSNKMISADPETDDNHSGDRAITPATSKTCFYYFYTAFSLTILTGIVLLLLGYTFFSAVLIAGSLVLLIYIIAKNRVPHPK
ncbi:MAG: hypothetical protein ABW080_03105 [Candidatus Thiodiazotropha sp.]